MFDFIKKYFVRKKTYVKVFAFAFTIFLVVFVLVAPHQATAASQLIDIGAKSVFFVVNAVLVVLLSFVGQGVKLMGWFVGLFMSLNQTLLSDIGNDKSFVMIGWTVFRDLANLGFVFGIIVIAVSTILRLQSYQAKAILWKLIVAALLVNFSLVMAGAIISISDVFSNFFISSIKGTDVGSGSAMNKLVAQFNFSNIAAKIPTMISSCTDGTVIGNAADECKNSKTKMACENNYILKNCPPDKRYSTPLPEEPSPDSLTALGNASGTLIDLLLAIIVGAIICVILFAFGFTLLLRYFYLGFLLILSPIVWLLWIFPYTQNHWKKWWETFIKWVMYAPVMLLFVWISLTVMNAGADSYVENYRGSIDGQTGGASAGFFSKIMIPLMAAALLIGGMKVSIAMGMGGASFVMNAAKKTGNWAKTKAVRGAAIGMQKTGVGKAVQGRLTKWGSTGFGKAIGLGALSRQTARAGAAVEEKAGEGMKEFRGSLKDIKPEDRAKLLGTTGGAKRAELISMMAEEGKLGSLAKEGMTMDDVSKSIKTLEGAGRAGDARTLEKKYGMNQKMMDAMKSGNGEEYSKEQGEFFGKFGSRDWADFAKSRGSDIYSDEDQIGGMTKEQTKMYRDVLNESISASSGKAFGALNSELSGNAQQKLNGSLANYELNKAKGPIEVSRKVIEEQQVPALGADGKQMIGPDNKTPLTKPEKVERVKMVDVREEIKNKLQSNDKNEIREAIKLMGQTNNESFRKLSDTISHGIGSAISGAYNPRTESAPDAKAAPSAPKAAPTAPPASPPAAQGGTK